MFMLKESCETTTRRKNKQKQEGHDGPEVAHLYMTPGAGPVLTPWLLFEQTWKTPIRRYFMMLSFYFTHIMKNNDLCLPYPYPLPPTGPIFTQGLLFEQTW
jgi:hypothetical protein